MRAALTIALLTAVAAPAVAKQTGRGTFVEFKVSSQQPSVFKSKIIFDLFDRLIPDVEACGTVKQPGKVRSLVGVVFDIATDGAITKVSIDGGTTKMTPALEECLSKAFQTGSFPARTRASKLTFSLIYRK